MANAKKCDRCGKYYDKNDRKMWLYTANPDARNALDLCDECVTELKKWFDESKDENNE